MRTKVVLVFIIAVSAAAGAWAYFRADLPHWAGGPVAAVIANDRWSAKHPTFSRDVAPLVFENCAVCHHEGGAGPFALLNYSDVQRHAKQIVNVTSGRLMPPWPPDQTCGPFVGQRGLSDSQIAMLQRWAADGSPLGDPAALPPEPRYSTDWQLGPPDAIVRPETSFTVPPDGKDIYENVVFPLALEKRQSVRAIELRGKNLRVMHHATLLVDDSGAALARARRNGGAGYPSMDAGSGIKTIDGLFLAWQPGVSSCIQTPDAPWPLPAGANIVVQMHLRPTGKPETIEPELGLYFTDKPAYTRQMKLMLRSTAIDIPAGSSDYSIDAAYVLPVDAEAIAVSAHAHYLGHDLEGYAMLPDLSRRSLLHIPDWNFYWQGGYQYQHPVHLPKGTVIQMHYTYDNSSQNPPNPFNPPRRVQFGLNSTDEMGEFWVVLRTQSDADMRTLRGDYLQKVLFPDSIAFSRTQVRLHPQDATLHAELGQNLLGYSQTREGLTEIQQAIALDPDCALAHHLLANILFQQGQYAQAVDQFRKAVQNDPADFRAQADLGLAIAVAGNSDQGVIELRKAIEQNPRDALTHTNLARVLLIQTKKEEARKEIETALKLDPQLPLARQTLESINSAK